MRSVFVRLAAIIAVTPAFFTFVQAQTHTDCNPMKKECPKNPALSGNYEHIYGGAAPGFTATGSGDMILYQNDGAHFRIEKTNDAPTITSNFYIMYGRLESVLLAAPGAGIVSSLVLLSNTLDEIDWEWIGIDSGRAQSNYFGKGNTETYTRGAFHNVNHQEFHAYGIEWTPEFVKWSIDGTVVRTLTPQNVEGDFYPQTPMQIKIGSWSGGDPQNQPGVIEWARGPTDYSKGPFDMIVKSIKVQDYSTGKFYYYSDRSGSASSIRSEGGQIMVGASDKPGNIGDDVDKPIETPTTTPRAPSNSGRITSSTTTSTKPKTTSTNDDDEDTDDSKTTQPPTTTTASSSSGFLTSTSTLPELIGTGGATNSTNITAPTNSGAPENDGSAAIGTYRIQFGAQVIVAIAGIVGVGLVL
ncbi:concanavalin A-like lectin/glucanase domain-containing protein [Kalaharituber pfeilii]|nr:concanavalin A-like lectin/glucanase domain-containing protein [Kalaharituber pfeilii]